MHVSKTCLSGALPAPQAARSPGCTTCPAPRAASPRHSSADALSSACWRSLAARRRGSGYRGARMPGAPVTWSLHPVRSSSWPVSLNIRPTAERTLFMAAGRPPQPRAGSARVPVPARPCDPCPRGPGATVQRSESGDGPGVRMRSASAGMLGSVGHPDWHFSCQSRRSSFRSPARSVPLKHRFPRCRRRSAAQWRAHRGARSAPHAPGGSRGHPACPGFANDMHLVVRGVTPQARAPAPPQVFAAIYLLFPRDGHALLPGRNRRGLIEMARDHRGAPRPQSRAPGAAHRPRPSLWAAPCPCLFHPCSHRDGTMHLWTRLFRSGLVAHPSRRWELLASLLRPRAWRCRDPARHAVPFLHRQIRPWMGGIAGNSR